MALHKHACIEGDGEEVAEIADALGLVLAAAIGEEDEGDAVSLEVGEGFGGVGKGSGGAEEDAVNTGVRKLVLRSFSPDWDEKLGHTQMRMRMVELSWNWC